MVSNILDKVSYYSLFVAVVLLPVFFLPFTSVPIESSKNMLLVLGLAISIIAWSAARFSDGKLIWPKSWQTLTFFGVVIATLLSALFSSVKAISFFGLMFDTGSFWFILASFLLMLFSAFVFREEKHAKKILTGLAVAFLVVFVFQILRIISPSFFSLGVLGSSTDSIAGAWNTFGVLAGFMLVLSVFASQFLELNKKSRYTLYAVLALALFFLMAVNFFIVWVLVGAFSLLIFVYKISIDASHRHEDSKIKFPMLPFVLVLVSLLFLMSGGLIGGFLPKALNAVNFEVNPLLSSTFDVTKGVLSKDPVFGMGPNRFAEAWAMYKPNSVNYSPFWETPFVNGSGLLPTFMATTGILGILAWVVFLVAFLFFGFKYLLETIKRKEVKMPVIFLLGSMYLFTASFFYTGGVVVFFLAVVFLGIFIGLSSSMREHGEKHIAFLNDPRKSFFLILALVLIMIASASMTFKFMERFVSVAYFGNAISADNLDKAEKSINKALLIYTNDLYYRTYSDVFLSKFTTLANKSEALTNEETAELRRSFEETVKGATLATQANPENYLNFQKLAAIQSLLGSYGVEGSYDKAIEAYQKVIALNPINPGTRLSIADAYFMQDKFKEARDYSNEALSLKGDYIDPVIMLSQIEKKEGNTAKAIFYAEQALALDPNNIGLQRYLDSLNGKDTSSEASKEETKETSKDSKSE